jgi:catechol 2,3-dioxygenase-like lactoylglutathione lyase family enzyme
MSVSGLDHYAIRTLKLSATRDFYVEALGMEDGERPDFPFPGHWLYLGGQALVHLIGIDPDDTSGLERHLREIDRETLVGSGAVDHLAFRGSGAGEQMARLKARGIAYRENRVPGMDLFQIFIEDPNDITVELNFFGEGA